MKSRGKICVCIAASDGAAVLEAITPVLPLVDVVEIRLDGMVNPQVADCIKSLNKPVLATNRPLWEGGQWSGTEETRADLLCQALSWGARFVDIELRAAPAIRARIREQADQCGAQMIISSHNFQTTPSSRSLTRILNAMRGSGANIGKIVVTANNPGDCLRVLTLQEKAMSAGFPLCAFAMGESGAISRLATLKLGGFMTYAALNREQATAPGQLTVETLHQMLHLLKNPA